MENMGPNSNGHSDSKETLYLLGGVAMIVFGAGLILTNSSVKRLLGDLGLEGIVQHSVPDLQRYLQLRDM